MENWSTKGLENTNMETEQCKNSIAILINMYLAKIRKIYNEIYIIYNDGYYN